MDNIELLSRHCEVYSVSLIGVARIQADIFVRKATVLTVIYLGGVHIARKRTVNPLSTPHKGLITIPTHPIATRGAPIR